VLPVVITVGEGDHDLFSPLHTAGAEEGVPRRACAQLRVAAASHIRRETGRGLGSHDIISIAATAGR
jgi:hypothetical protein